jgi:hypothetical protein
MKKQLVLVLIVTGSAIKIAGAQEKIKEGKATFSFSYPDKERTDEKVLESKKTNGLTIYFKDGKSKAEYDNKNMNMYIVDPQEKMITAFYGNTAVKTTFEEAQNLLDMFYGDSATTVTGETKMIAGFKCYKAVHVSPPGVQPSRLVEIWFTKDLKASNINYDFREIEGFIMEYTSKEVNNSTAEGAEFTEIMTCSKVEKITVPDEKFKVPPGYEVRTREEFRRGARIEYH